MSIKPAVLFLLAFLSSVALACTLGAALTLKPAALLDQAENKWKGQAISDYRIEVLVVNGLWHAQTQTMVVRNQIVVESSAVCVPAPTEQGKCELRDFSPEHYTVPALFSQAKSQLASDQSQWVKLAYDPDYGFPSQISFDDPQVLDEDWSWKVTAFEVLR